MNGNKDFGSVTWPPVERDARFRVEMTVGCRDCDSIPKHADAGKIVVEDGHRVQVMHNGVRVIAGGYGSTWTEEIITRLRGHHEPQEELVFHELLRALPHEATMIELGGHWSYYSLWFLSQSPDQRRAIVIEPDPNNLAVGRLNAALNQRKIEFVAASVGDRPSSGDLFQTETAGLLTLPQVTLPDLFDTFGIDHLDLLHCDAQGAELPVILSSLDLFREGRIGHAVFSTHAHAITGDPLTHQKCLALLESVGAKIIAEHDVHESFSGDGLIAACTGSAVPACPPVAVSYNRYSRSFFRNPVFDFDDALSTTRSLERQIEQLHALHTALHARHTALVAEFAAAQAQVREKSAAIDRWWASADGALREISMLKQSWSWRLTKPVRMLAGIGRSIRKRARHLVGLSPVESPTRLADWQRRRHRLSRSEIKRFFERQRRSLRKRWRRWRGLPADVLPVPRFAPAAAPLMRGDLPEVAQSILDRLERLRKLAAHDAARDHARSRRGRR